jgi:ATP-dependent Clp protease ATP-binding subunit ClpC
VKKVIEQSFQEARDLGAEKVDTEHLLLAIVKHGPATGVAGAALTQLGVTEEAVRGQLAELR